MQVRRVEAVVVVVDGRRNDRQDAESRDGWSWVVGG